MSADLSQFYQVFFEETAEHLAGMEKLLLTLDVSRPDMDQLNAIFRDAHSRRRTESGRLRGDGGNFVWRGGLQSAAAETVGRRSDDSADGHDGRVGVRRADGQLSDWCSRVGAFVGRRAGLMCGAAKFELHGTVADPPLRETDAPLVEKRMLARGKAGSRIKTD